MKQLIIRNELYIAGRGVAYIISLSENPNLTEVNLKKLLGKIIESEKNPICDNITPNNEISRIESKRSLQTGKLSDLILLVCSPNYDLPNLKTMLL